MEAAPSAKPRREPPPIPPNYVSLKQLRELRLKEKEEEEEKRRREEEDAAAAAAKRAAALKAEEAAAVKREAALKAGTKGPAVSREAFGGAKERHRGGQGKQWVAVAQRAPATAPRPTPTCAEVAAREKEWIVGGNRGKKGPDDVADNAHAPHPHGGCKSRWKGKKKKKASSCHTVGEPGNLAEAAAPAASNGGKPENKSEIKAMGKASVAPLDPAKAAVGSSPGHLTCKGRKGAGGRSAETNPGDAPAKTAGRSPPRGVKSGNTGKPQPGAPRLADAGTGSDSPEGKEAAPVQAPPTSVADKQKTVETKPGGRLVEGQHRQLASVARRSAEPSRRRGNGAAEPHGCVWVPKAKAAAAVGSSAGGGDK